jgi:hypothetical protein
MRQVRQRFAFKMPGVELGSCSAAFSVQGDVKSLGRSTV